MNFIIFKPDFVNFAEEVHKVAYLSVNSIADQHFVKTEVIVSGFNKEGRAIQLRAPIGHDLVHDRAARQDSFDKAKSYLNKCQGYFEKYNIECRNGTLSTADKPVNGSAD